MVAYVALGLLLLGSVVLLARWFVAADPRTLAKAFRIALIALGAIVILALVATGRIGLASIIFGALLPALVRWRAVSRVFRNATGPSPDQRSEVSARFLRMTLDHDTGVMSGTVLDGPQRGRKLSELSRAELLELLRECRAEDPQSASLLEAWLDRADPDWRQTGEEARAAPASDERMSREEAYRILGLAPGAGEAEIRDAHRKLMLKLHPDRGGPSYLAAKINAAKDLLLGT